MKQHLKSLLTKIFYSLVLLSPFFAYSQFGNTDLFLEGYIITSKDTINCFVNVESNYSGRIKYKINKEDKTSLKIRSNQVLKLKGLYIYDRIKYRRKSMLMKQEVKGHITLYKYLFSSTISSTNYYRSNYSNEVTVFYLVKNDTVYRINRHTFKDDLNAVMNDIEVINERINEIKYSELHYKIQAIVKDYNWKIKTQKK